PFLHDTPSVGAAFRGGARGARRALTVPLLRARPAAHRLSSEGVRHPASYAPRRSVARHDRAARPRDRRSGGLPRSTALFTGLPPDQRAEPDSISSPAGGRGLQTLNAMRTPEARDREAQCERRAARIEQPAPQTRQRARTPAGILGSAS